MALAATGADIRHGTLALAGLPAIGARLADPHAALLLAEAGRRLVWANPAAARAFRLADDAGGAAGLAAAVGRHLAAGRRLGPGVVRLRAGDDARGLAYVCRLEPLRLPDGEAAVLVTIVDPVPSAPADEAARLAEVCRSVAGAGYAAILDDAGSILAEAGPARLAAALAAHPGAGAVVAIGGTRWRLVVVGADGAAGAATPVAETHASPAAEAPVAEAPPAEVLDDGTAPAAASAPGDAAAGDVVDTAAAPPLVPAEIEPAATDGAGPAGPEDELSVPAATAATMDPVPAASSAPAAADPAVAAVVPEAAAPTTTAGHRPAARRFTWQTDADDRFSFVSPEFAAALGGGADVVGRRWHDLADRLSLDPDGRVAANLARRLTWSGATVDWPTSDGRRVPVDLAGLSVHGPDGRFNGFRGFGTVRPADARPVADAPAPTAAVAPVEAIAAALPAADAPSVPATEPATDTTLASAPGVAERSEPASAAAPPSVDGPAPAGVAIAPEAAAPGPSPAAASPPTPPPAATPPWFPAASPPPASEPVTAGIAAQDATPAAPPAAAPPPWFPAPAATAEPTEPTSSDSGEGAAEAHAEAKSAADAAGIPAGALDVPAADAPPAAASPAEAPLAAAVPADDAAVEDPFGLSRPEWEAFRLVAAALGARFEGDHPPSIEPAALGDPAAEGPTRIGPDASPEAPADAPASASAGPRLSAPVAANDAGAASLLDKIPTALIVCRGETLLHVNPAALALLGYRDRSELGAAGGLAALFAEPAEAGARRVRIRRADGATEAVDARITSIPWNGGTGLLVALTGAAAEPAGDDETFLDGIVDAVVVLDAGGAVVAANTACERLLGRPRDDLRGAGVAHLVAPDGRIAIGAALAAVRDGPREGGDRVEAEVSLIAGDGTLVPAAVGLGRVGTGAQMRICLVLRDRRAHRAADAALALATREAERVNAQKSELLAHLGHEVRTPINAIVGFAEVMLEERFGPIGEPRYRDYLRDVRASGLHVLSLVDDLLDLARIEAGGADLEMEPVALNEVVRDCVAMLLPKASQERVIVRMSLADDLPAVLADRRSLKQIVLNLLSNAIKFNVSGGQVILSTGRDEAGGVTLRVRDTGIGMAPADLDLALEPFRRVHGARFGGTGLGLPLTKALVEANAARFSIESEPRQGTLVEITFPAPGGAARTDGPHPSVKAAAPESQLVV